MRLFLAIELSNAARQHLVSVGMELKAASAAQHWPRVAWTRPANLHITLKFLGDAPDDRVPAMCAALSNVRPAGAMQLWTAGLECFPDRGPVRIVAVRIGGGADGLSQLYKDVEGRCALLGFPRERRTYRGHVTLGRARDPLPSSARSTLANATIHHWPGPAFDAAEFVLMQSMLKREGSEYIKVETFPIAPS